MRRSIEIALLLTGALSGVQRAGAQTIAEYSRAQRSVIDTAIQRQSPRPLPAVQPPPLPVSPIPPTSSREVPGLTEPSPTTMGPRVTLTGVVAFANRRVAEVTVDEVAHVLAIGDDVPGTGWRVHAVSATDIVVAPRRLSSTGRISGLRTFSLAQPAH